jgi:tetratricopeptide (TPR) repeat protein
MNTTLHNHAIALLSLLVITGAAYFIYSAALGGAFNFDDAPHLQALAFIEDLPSALAFIVSGDAGPLGRPIALASFALQFSAWPHSPEEFLYTNILIHLINGLLVAWFALRLARVKEDISGYALPFALTLFSLWTLQPLLASASLMVVQRMTTLSATFVLVGLVGYLAGRQRIVHARRRGWPMMVGSLGVATLLAVLTKETGALLPVYVWVLEYTLFDSPQNIRIFSVWRRLLHVPVAVLLGYTILQLPHIFEVTQRGFSAWQRLVSEGPILWTYLRLIVLPKSSDLGPFHDDIAVSASLIESPQAFLAWSAWGVLIATAILLRRRFPWFSFTAGWFLLGHALESTLFNLELYFEHRNYLPSLGPLAWISASVWRVPKNYKRVVVGVTATYVLLLGFVLHEVTAAWGSPDIAARLWADKHPASERAQQFLANRLIAGGDVKLALSVIENAYDRDPFNIGLALQAVQLSCALGEDVSVKVEQSLVTLSRARVDYSILDTLEMILNQYQQRKCLGLTQEAMHRLIDNLLANHHYQGLAITRFKLHHAKARLFFENRELDPTVRHLEQAFEALPDLDTGVLMVGLLNSAGLRDEALKKLEFFKQSLPLNPVLRQQWKERLNEVAEDLRQSANGF